MAVTKARTRAGARGWQSCAIALAAGIGTWAGAGSPGGTGIWISAQEFSSLSMEGAAWASLLETADEPAGTPDISDQDDDTDVRTMAKALVYARTGIESYRQQVIATCMAAIETENGGRTLALGRNLIGYVIAADLVGMPPSDDAVFRAWLDGVRFETLDGKTLISTHEDRPNNWGTQAGAARAAADVYLGDASDLAAAAMVFKGWLGDRDAYDGFDYGELWWQSNPGAPVGINPVGATIQGYPVDGVLPDDQRRGGPFEWPPPQENYVYTGLQGAVVQAEILHRQGYDAWNWEDQALRRAFNWLHDEASYPAVGDDTWQPHLVNFRYGTNFPAPIPSNHGKSVGWTDWTHAGACVCDINGDGVVDNADKQQVIDDWGCQGPCPGDVTGNLVVDMRDLLAVLANWGECPGGDSAPQEGRDGAGEPPAIARVRDPFWLADELLRARAIAAVQPQIATQPRPGGRADRHEPGGRLADRMGTSRRDAPGGPLRTGSFTNRVTHKAPKRPDAGRAPGPGLAPRPRALPVDPPALAPSAKPIVRDPAGAGALPAADG